MRPGAEPRSLPPVCCIAWLTTVALLSRAAVGGECARDLLASRLVVPSAAPVARQEAPSLQLITSPLFGQTVQVSDSQSEPRHVLNSAASSLHQVRVP